MLSLLHNHLQHFENVSWHSTVLASAAFIRTDNIRFAHLPDDSSMYFTIVRTTTCLIPGLGFFCFFVWGFCWGKSGGEMAEARAPWVLISNLEFLITTDKTFMIDYNS